VRISTNNGGNFGFVNELTGKKRESVVFVKNGSPFFYAATRAKFGVFAVKKTRQPAPRKKFFTILASQQINT